MAQPPTITLSRRLDDSPQRIALLRPPTLVRLEGLSWVGPMPPVGIAYVAAALRSVGHDVEIIDSPGEAMEQYDDRDTPIGRVRRIGLSIPEMVDRIRPGTRIVGVSHMFAHEWPSVRELCEEVRRRLPEAFVVVGGENATAFWPWMFEQTESIDACVLGEGEHTVVELVARVASGVSLDGMQGVAVRDSADGGPSSGGLPVRFRNLEAIPRPAWDLFPIESYFRYHTTLGVDRGRSMPILATRGCPYKCSFCSSPQMWTTRYNVRDPEDVADELAGYVEKYGIRNAVFVDLTPITKRSWTLAFADAMERRGLDISLQLPIGTRSEVIDDEVVSRLKSAGVTNITFAPETGSQHMLEVYDKRLDLDHVIASIRAAHRSGMATHIHTIVGHPKETPRDLWLTYKLMLRGALAGLASTDAIMFHPYPGSADFTEMVEAGALVPDDTYCLDGLTRGGASINNWNPHLTSKQLHRLQILMVGSFLAVSHLLHPSRFVHLVRNVLFGGDENSELESFLRVKRRGFAAHRRGEPTETPIRAGVDTAALPTESAHPTASQATRSG